MFVGHLNIWRTVYLGLPPIFFLFFFIFYNIHPFFNWVVCVSDIHSFNKSLLGTQSKPSFGPGPGETAVTRSHCPFRVSAVWWRRQGSDDRN